ncbi:unnamed protein product [Oikopleura dioica]|uniref:Uncharacterized protein n=1 Tax=Oikopleura dioica TaxID=34765 RepID=E4Y1A1_OIKDI|nr:unnamed protein product [Oikopleura dioica]
MTSTRKLPNLLYSLFLDKSSLVQSCLVPFRKGDSRSTFLAVILKLKSYEFPKFQRPLQRAWQTIMSWKFRCHETLFFSSNSKATTNDANSLESIWSAIKSHSSFAPSSSKTLDRR